MHREVLEAAHQIATQFLDSVASRHVGGTTTRAALLDASLPPPLRIGRR